MQFQPRVEPQRESHSPMAAEDVFLIQRLDEQKSRPRWRIFRKWQEGVLALCLLSPALVLFALFSYEPFLRAIWLSLHITNELGDPVKYVGLRYYGQIFNIDGVQDSYLQSLLVSCQFAVMVVVLEIVGGLGLASLALAKVRGIGIFQIIFTMTIVISQASSSVIWSLILDPNTGVTVWLNNVLNLAQPGLLNNTSTALISVAVMSVWSGLGFNFVITLAGIQAIPQEFHESAAIDGAGGWKRFRFITLPLLSPVLLFLLVVDTIQSFQAFTQFNILMNGPGPDSATNVFVYALYQSFWFDHRYGFASAMSVILFLILLILSATQMIFLGKRVHYR